jgi:hypothetical protein
MLEEIPFSRETPRRFLKLSKLFLRVLVKNGTLHNMGIMGVVN